MVAEVLPLEDRGRDWDALVAGTEGGTFCHLSGWRNIMREVLGHRCEYLTAVDAGGSLLGILPLVEVRSRLLGHFWVSMPFLNDGGPLGSDEAQAALGERAISLASRSGASLLEMRTRQPPPGGMRASHRKVAVHLPLPATTDELWKQTFRAKLRSQIRRPAKEGMETRIGPDRVGPFYEVFARNMRDLGTPVLPRAFFEAIARTFPEHAVFATVEHQGRAVAAGCGFAFGNEFEITWASSLREYNRSAPNMLLYASLMEHAIGREVGVFNFGRCTPGGPTHRFKLQWGGFDVPLPWVQWSPKGVDATPNPDQPVFRIATAAWQRLPLVVANRLGPVLARRLP